jgi:hypothetical protein
MFHNKTFFSDIIITVHFGRIDTDVSVVGTNMKIILWDDFVEGFHFFGIPFYESFTSGPNEISKNIGS